MGSCCQRALSTKDSQTQSQTQLEIEPLETHVPTETSVMKFKINTPILSRRQHQQAFTEFKPDSVEEFKILASDDSSSDFVRKGILKSVSGKSLRSGGSSVGSSQKRVQFCIGVEHRKTCTFFASPKL